jgi:hypothetical protein
VLSVILVVAQSTRQRLKQAMVYQTQDLSVGCGETAALLPSEARELAERSNARYTRLKLLFVCSIVGAASFASGAALFRDSSMGSEPKNRTVTLKLESRSKKHHKTHKTAEYDDAAPTCEDGKYSSRTLKLAYELPFAALFRDNKGERKYEASSVVVVGDNAYAVCDSSWSVSKFGSQLTPFAKSNVQIGEAHREKDDSGYEALVHEKGIFYVIRESILHKLDTSYHAIIEELVLGDQDYEVQDKCSTEFEFEGTSKGFEGAAALYDINNELVILGLCEGNHCSEEFKKDKGNGRVVAMKKTTQDNLDGTTSCQWQTIRTIQVPSSAYFEDYSAMTIDESGKVGITSQEESQFWVGKLLGKDLTTGLWDIDKVEFDSQTSRIYDFPKNDACEVVYCNIEGVTWITNSDMIMAVSDKMKGRGKQPYRCSDKDQSVHVFSLPT